MIFKIALVLICALALPAQAQVQQARGKATITYQGAVGSADDKARASMAAQLKAIEIYYAEAGESESENFDGVREKIIANPDRYILESTILAEQDIPDRKQIITSVRISLNVAALRNLVRSGSAVGTARSADKSQLAFVFVSREVASVKSFDDRVYKRIEETAKGQVAGSRSETGVEGESLGRGQIRTNTSVISRGDVSASLARSVETGGSTLKRASDSTYRLIPSANLNQVFTATFTRAGFRVLDAAFVEPATGGLFKVSRVEDDYRSGNDLPSATLQAIASGMRQARVPYVALGTLDVGAADKDPTTGLMRVAVTVNARIFDVTQPIPEVRASVGPVLYSGVGPSEGEARGNALQQAAGNAARELASQVTAQRVQ